jgi:hypothetical protein
VATVPRPPTGSGLPLGAPPARRARAEMALRRPDGGWAPRLTEVLVLAVALALALYLRLSGWFGVMRVDSFNYVDVAMGLLRGEAVFDDAHLVMLVQAIRLTVDLPLVPIFALFGADERTATIWPLLCSLGSVALVFAVGRRLGGPSVGALAALIMAAYPIEVLYATQLLPDAVLPCAVLLVVLTYLRAEERRAVGGFALAGVALGVAYYARLNAPVVLLFLLIGSAARRRLGRAQLAMLPTFLVVVALGELLFFLNGGVPLYGIWRTLYVSSINPEFRSPNLAPVFAGMLWNHPLFRTWTMALPVALAGLVALRPRRWWLAPLWLATTYVYLEWLSQWPVVSLPEKGDRMLTILSAPLALTIALAAGTALARVPWAGARGALLLLAVGLAVPTLALPGLRQVPLERLAYWDWRGRALHELADGVAALPAGPVYFVNDWRAWVALYRGYPAASLRPGGPPRAARLATGEAATLLRVRQDDSLMVLDARDAYVVQDLGVMLRRPQAWRPVGRVGAQTTIWYAPPEVDERRWVVHLEPELFDAVRPDQDEALAGLVGWGSYSQPAYSRGKAAIAKDVGARMTRQIPPLPAGRLALTVQVHDYGGARNRVALTLNGARVDLAWGEPTAGARALGVSVRTDRAGGEIALELVERGQPYAIVDAIDVEPEP